MPRRFDLRAALGNRGQRRRMLPFQLMCFTMALGCLHVYFNLDSYAPGLAGALGAGTPEAAIERSEHSHVRGNARHLLDATPDEILLDNEDPAKATNKGWLVLHFIGTIYMFTGLAIICDEYFVAALEEMCDRWAVTEDVAGATFMAAGGSAPELFTSLMAVFVAPSDVGFGTIVGSAVFNVLFVIGLCAIFAKQALELTWWPLARDCSCYTVGLIVLVVFVEDQSVEWWEALILFLLYCGYVLIMKHNEGLHAWFEVKLANSRAGKDKGRITPDPIPETDAESGKVVPVHTSDSLRSLHRTFTKRDALGAMNPSIQMRDFQRRAVREIVHGHTEAAGDLVHKVEDKSEAVRAQVSEAWKESQRHLAGVPEGDAGTRAKVNLPRSDVGRAGHGAGPPLGKPPLPEPTTETAADGEAEAGATPGADAGADEKAEPASAAAGAAAASKAETDADAETAAAAAIERAMADKDMSSGPAGGGGDGGGGGAAASSGRGLADAGVVPVEGGDDDDEEGPESPFDVPESAKGKVYWAICLPLSLALYFTVPDCTNARWKNWFLVTFFMSLVWIAVFSYFMVWFAAVIGYALGIPDAVMGLTILAGGTSIPDALSSVIVARNGFGDMAVSSSIGSNIFDICVGLPVPWLIKTAMVDPGSVITINSCGLFVSVLTLLLMVLFVVLSIKATGWVLDMRLGWIMFVLYVLFLTESLLLEYKVIVLSNDPKCQ